MGELSMRPEDLHNGANAFGQHAEALQGHAQRVGDLATGLRAAFAGAGEASWPAVQARLTELAGRFETAHARTSDAGSMLREAANGSTAIDQQGSTTIRM